MAMISGSRQLLNVRTNKEKRIEQLHRLPYNKRVIMTMTVSELVGDTCQETKTRAARGEEILAKRGRGPVFKTLPHRAKSPSDHVAALEADLRRLARAAKNNPVMKLRTRRR